MFRIALLPFILLVTGVLLTLLAFFLIRKIKRTTKKVIKKTTELANEQQQKWTEQKKREQERKKLPEIIQKAYIQLEDIEKNEKELPNHWKSQLTPVIDQANVILLAVSSKPEMADHIRSYFLHTLDTLLQLVNKLKTDHALMDDQQIEIARQNITAFKADLNQHQQTLQKQNKFDFEVLMEVIKARLKQ